MPGYEENLKSYSANGDASVGIWTGVPGQPGSAVPNTGMQYRGLKITGANQVGLATGASDLVVGILQNKPQKPGMACTVGHIGISMGVAGGAVSAGDEVVVDDTGRFVPGAGTGGGLRFVSHSIAAGAGEIIALQIL
jgi:hypothetical protein